MYYLLFFTFLFFILFISSFLLYYKITIIKPFRNCNKGPFNNFISFFNPAQDLNIFKIAYSSLYFYHFGSTFLK